MHSNFFLIFSVLVIFLVFKSIFRFNFFRFQFQHWLVRVVYVYVPAHSHTIIVLHNKSIKIKNTYIYRYTYMLPLEKQVEKDVLVLGVFFGIHVAFLLKIKAKITKIVDPKCVQIRKSNKKSTYCHMWGTSSNVYVCIIISLNLSLTPHIFLISLYSEIRFGKLNEQRRGKKRAKKENWKLCVTFNSINSFEGNIMCVDSECVSV